MTDLTELTVAEIRDGVAAGSFTAVEVAEAFNTNIAAAQPALNAFIVATPERALDAARATDAKRAAGEPLGAMGGVPIGMKDLFATQGVQTSAASHILEGFVPEYESHVSQRLWNAGAGMLGKLNLDQFAMGSSNETSHFGNVISPWQRRDSNAPLAPGGSSGGSSAAVAARLCPAATGTDTGGSIRQPAAFTGIAGIKPTYGRCSRWGIVAFASSLDQAGPMARTSRDCAIMLGAMAGFDAKDATSLDLPVPDWEAGSERRYARQARRHPARIPDGRHGCGRRRPVGTGHRLAEGRRRRMIVDVSLPHTRYALPTYYIIAPAECLVQPRALRRRALWPARSPAGEPADTCTRKHAPRASVRR